MTTWPFPPLSGPVPWTRKQIADYNRARQQQQPAAPF